MRQFAIPSFVLVVTTTMIVGAAGLAPAEARAHKSGYIKKHQARPIVFSRRFAPPDQAWPATPARQSGAVCPGISRSFDCKIWPPPFDDDPDRKMSGTDGG